MPVTRTFCSLDDPSKTAIPSPTEFVTRTSWTLRPLEPKTFTAATLYFVPVLSKDGFLAVYVTVYVLTPPESCVTLLLRLPSKPSSSGKASNV